MAGATLLVVAGLLFPLAIIANWARTTVYDSNTFAERAVAPLDSEAVRRELARRLTEQLVQAGNQQATAFRPAFELALDGVIDTDTFRSIFRNAVRRTHEAIIAGHGAGTGLDLGASFTLIASGLQASGGSQQQGSKGLDNSLSDVSKRLDDLGVWNLEDTIDTIAIACLLGSFAAAAGSILLADDRRRAVRRLGWALAIGGIAIVAFLVAATWLIGRQIDDPRLGNAISSALGKVTDDLRLTGLWIAAYGLVIAAAAMSTGRVFTPAEAWRRTRGWIERRRGTTWGTLLLGALGILISVVFVQEPLGNFELLIRGVALWVGYLALTEIVRLVRTVTARTRERRARWSRVAVVGGTITVVLSVVTFGFVLSTRGAARAADKSGTQTCNGAKSLCDLRLDQVTFPGVHHAFASSDYPGYLFAQQVDTITQQLHAGVRALNIDTHYGVPSTARVPGQDTPIVLTDRVAEAGARAQVNEDGQVQEAAAKRAAQLAARAPKAVDAQRGIYLCHSNCETGAISFEKGLNEIKSFLDTHPDDVLMVTLHDFTAPADTAAAIEAAGLADRAATLRRGAPLPTLRELIDSGRNLLVFAERGAPGGPPWYMSMYEWFQETSYSFSDKAQFNCHPNRGPSNAPLFLINHWLTLSPPDPTREAAVNSRADLEKRIQQCIAERGLVPNILQVQFAERGDLISTVRSINQARLKEERSKRKAAQQPPAPPPQATIVTPPPEAAPLPAPPEVTTITTLTGGDPSRFCPALPNAVRSISAWAETILGDAPAEAGVTDLVYGPLLEQDVGEYVKAAPKEVARQATPILDRARAAVKTLRQLGVSDTDIKRLADAAAFTLRSPGSPDGVTVKADLVKRLEERIPADRLQSAGLVFSSGQPDPAGLLDLGFVPEDVGRAAGFNCAPVLATV